MDFSGIDFLVCLSLTLYIYLYHCLHLKRFVIKQQIE